VALPAEVILRGRVQTNEEAFRCVFHMREEDQGLLIERLEKTNYEFERLAAAYDEVNRQI